MGHGVGVGDLEAAFLEVVAEIEDGAADEEGALGIDDDADVLGFDEDVAIGWAIDEVHFILEAGTAAADDGDAEGALLAALLAQEAGKTGSGMLGEFDELFVADLVVDRCGWVHRWKNGGGWGLGQPLRFYGRFLRASFCLTQSRKGAKEEGKDLFAGLDGRQPGIGVGFEMGSGDGG